jgi:hypothetical protein
MVRQHFKETVTFLIFSQRKICDPKTEIVWPNLTTESCFYSNIDYPENLVLIYR